MSAPNPPHRPPSPSLSLRSPPLRPPATSPSFTDDLPPPRTPRTPRGREEEGLDVSRVGRVMGLKVLRGVRRGQLPFLFLFFTCVLIFFSALTGQGYSDPTSSTLIAKEESFQLGQPVYDPDGGRVLSEEERREALRSLEMEWMKEKRKSDGAWMQKQRDQRVIRHPPRAAHPPAAPLPPPSEPTTTFSTPEPTAEPAS